jgi:hypothetical protein
MAIKGSKLIDILSNTADNIRVLHDNVVTSRPYRFALHTTDSLLTVFGRSFTTCYNIDFHSMRDYDEARLEELGLAPRPIPSDYAYRK